MKKVFSTIAVTAILLTLNLFLSACGSVDESGGGGRYGDELRTYPPESIFQFSVNSNEPIALTTEEYELADATTNGEHITENEISPMVSVSVAQISVPLVLPNGMFLDETGVLWAWGNNGNGELGDGTTAHRYSPVVIMDSVRYVTGGASGMLVLQDDDTLWGWGHNFLGQLGDGTTERRIAPVKLMDSVAKVISLGLRDATFVLQNDGTLWGWGITAFDGVFGESSIDRIIYPVKIMDSVVEVFADGDIFALRNDNSLWALGVHWRWRVEHYYPINIMNDVKTVLSSHTHQFAVHLDGSLWDLNMSHLWSEPERGIVPIRIMDSGVDVMVLTGSIWWTYGGELRPPQIAPSFFVLQNDRSLWAWGENGYGQLGDGTTEYRNYPVKIMEDVESIQIGVDSINVILTDGSLWAWGGNKTGLVGDGTTEQRFSPVQIMDSVVSVNRAANVGGRTFDSIFVVQEDGSLWAWGFNQDGQLGDGTRECRTTPVRIMDSVQYVVTTGFSTFAMQADGSVWAWGINSFGNLGDGTTERRLRPVRITFH